MVTRVAAQDICEHFFDYEVLSSVRVRDFQFRGRKVFSHADEHFRVKLMIKRLNSS